MQKGVDNVRVAVSAEMYRIYLLAAAHVDKLGWRVFL